MHTLYITYILYELVQEYTRVVCILLASTTVHIIYILLYKNNITRVRSYVLRARNTMHNIMYSY